MDTGNTYNAPLHGSANLPGTYAPNLDLANYLYPTLELLEYYNDSITIDSETLEINKNKIVERATVGPSLTLYEFIPAPGVRVSKIKSLKADLALRLAAEIDIIGPIPGKGTMGIEVFHDNPGLVSIRSMLRTKKFQICDFDLPIALGRTMDNLVHLVDLTKLPHLLISGATGQGKSVCLNSIILSLLYKKHPSQLKFVLIDINKLEFGLFHKIKHHFLAKLPGEIDAIIGDPLKAINTLNGLAIELDQRYELLKNAGVRHIKEYNQKFIDRKLNPNDNHHFLPFVILVIDEFAELISADKEVELVISRLAQLGRAAGIHLIISTQRPTVKIITGTIKANFPSRLAFRVSSNIDSHTILDDSGAELLNGQGDMLLSTGAELIRLQGAFVSTADVERLSEFIGFQRGYPEAYLLPEYGTTHHPTLDSSDLDLFFEDAARLVVMHQQGSTALIQRKLKLGYNRAGRLIDQLEAAGVVGPFDGGKAREVNFTDTYSLELFLDSLKLGTPLPITPKSAKVKPTPTLSKVPEPNRKSFWDWLFK